MENKFKESLFKDPIQIKFVLGKFVIATNDEKNPVRLVRQLKTGDETKVSISLANGETYTDTVGALADLVSMTSNMAWEVSVTVIYDVGIEVCSESRSFIHSLMYEYDDEDRQDEYSKLISKIDEMLALTLIGPLTNIGKPYSKIDGSRFLPENPLIPNRLALVNRTVVSEISSNTENFKLLASCKETFVFKLISPEECVNSIVEELCRNLQYTSRFVYDRLASLPNTSIDFVFNDSKRSIVSFVNARLNSCNFAISKPWELDISETIAEITKHKDAKVSVCSYVFNFYQTQNSRSHLKGTFSKFAKHVEEQNDE